MPTAHVHYQAPGERLTQPPGNRHHVRVDEPRILAAVRLKDKHVPAGKTQHFIGAPGGPREPVSTPAGLRIAQYDGDAGVYLFYCDEPGRELTDTYHEGVYQAMAQAQFEFNVAPDEWLRL